MWYKIIATGVAFEWNTKEQTVTLKKSVFPFFWKKVEMTERVYFDVYDQSWDHKVFDWFANIDQDWIKLWYKQRNKIRDLITNHFKWQYVIGNFRKTLKKV